MDPSIDCAEARKRLREARAARRSQSPADLMNLARAVGYRIDRSRGKGSHVMAVGGPGTHFPIPTGKNPVRVGTATKILNLLEEALDRVCSP